VHKPLLVVARELYFVIVGTVVLPGPVGIVETEKWKSDLVKECLSHLDVMTCVDSTQLILAIQSLVTFGAGEQRYESCGDWKYLFLSLCSKFIHSSKKRLGSWLLAIDSICPFYWLDKQDGTTGVKVARNRCGAHTQPAWLLMSLFFVQTGADSFKSCVPV